MSKPSLCLKPTTPDPVHHVKKSTCQSTYFTLKNIPFSNCRHENLSLPPSFSMPHLDAASSSSSCNSADSSASNSMTSQHCSDDFENCPYEFVAPHHLLQVIQSKEEDMFLKDIIIMDCRENRLYQTNHVKFALSANCQTRTMAKRSIAQWTSLCPRNQGGKTIYVYDGKSSSQQGVMNDHLRFFISYLKRKGNDIFVLDGGWTQFLLDCKDNDRYLESCLEKQMVDRYTCSPTNRDSESEDIINATASRIKDHLWLGNERDAHDWELLHRLGITHILNVTNNVENYFENKRSLTYHRLPASDNNSQDLIKFFNEAYDFIENARLQNGRVLVHCWAGVSRSSTIVIAYLVRKLSMDVCSALTMVRNERKIVAPNFNFMGQLERFYKQEVLSVGVEMMKQTPPDSLREDGEVGMEVTKSAATKCELASSAFKMKNTKSNKRIRFGGGCGSAAAVGGLRLKLATSFSCSEIADHCPWKEGFSFAANKMAISVEEEQ